MKKTLKVLAVTLITTIVALGAISFTLGSKPQNSVAPTTVTHMTTAAAVKPIAKSKKVHKPSIKVCKTAVDKALIFSAKHAGVNVGANPPKQCKGIVGKKLDYLITNEYVRLMNNGTLYVKVNNG